MHTHNQSVYYKSFKKWLPLAVSVVLLTGLIYAGIQQNYRMSGNDPQVQIAEDIAQAIQAGTPPDSIVPATGSLEITKSLSPWVMIYDDTGKQIGTSALIDGKNPSYPTSIFDQVKRTGQEARVTWQPEAGVRMATVVTKYSGKTSGYIVAGRSLREIETRISMFTAMTAAACGLTLVISYLLIFLFMKLDEPKGAEHAEHEHREHHEHHA